MEGWQQGRCLKANLKDLPDKGEAVGVHAAGSKADEGVALLYPAAINDSVLLYGSHGKTRHVVLASLVEARHLRGLLSKKKGRRACSWIQTGSSLSVCRPYDSIPLLGVPACYCTLMVQWKAEGAGGMQLLCQMQCSQHTPAHLAAKENAVTLPAALHNASDHLHSMRSFTAFTAWRELLLYDCFMQTLLPTPCA